MEIFLKFDSTLTGLSPHPVENLPTYRYLSVREAFRIEKKRNATKNFYYHVNYHTRWGGSKPFFYFEGFPKDARAELGVNLLKM